MRPDSPLGAPVMLIGMTIGHSKSLGRMNGDERDGLLLGVRSSLDLTNRVLPIGAHVAGEGAQTTNVVGARHLEKDVGIGERAIGSGLETLTKLGANVQEARPRRTGSA